MTDLDKQAKEYANNWLKEIHELELKHKTDPKPEYIRILQAYKDGATQETALLSQHIIDLQKDKGNLTDKVRELEAENEQIKNSDTLCKLIGEQKRKIEELEAQIDKMKCCSNCDNWNWKHNKCEKKLKGDCFKHSKWVMRNF